MSVVQQDLLARRAARGRPFRPHAAPKGKPARRCGCSVFASKTAVVVGGGIGGLVTAGRLARQGLSVTVLEQNPEVGGRVQTVEMNGFRFDTGPSLLLFLNKYQETYEALGTKMEEHVTVQKIAPAAYRVNFGDNTHMDMLYDVQAMIAQLERFEVGAGKGYVGWLADARNALEYGTANFIDRDFDTFGEFLALDKLLPMALAVSPVELLGNHHWRMSQRFKDPRLRAFFTFQDLYVGLSPYNSPGVYSLLAGSDVTDGVWYPIGGFGKIKESINSIISKLGVKVRNGVTVTSINTTGDRVTGVTTASGEQLSADIVVTNRDLPLSYELLRGSAEDYGKQQAKKYEGWEYSCAVIAFDWGVNKRLDKLLHHNIFLSDEYQQSWQRAKTPAGLRRRPNFYVHVPNRTDPDAAPEGQDSVMVLLPVANMQESQTSDYKSLVTAGREAILRTFKESGVGDIRDNIVSEKVIDPLEWKERYGIQHGAVFGLSHGITQLALFRPAVKDAKVTGLYFAGASTRPGNGVPLVMVGAKLTAERIARDIAAGAFDAVPQMATAGKA